MAQLNFHKVTVLPGMLEANSIYFVENGSVAETYVTNSTGVARSVGNTSMINDVVDLAVDAAIGTAIEDAVSQTSAVEIVADIAARDALSLAANRLVLVLDATGDSTVNVGGAMYAYNHSTTTFSKVTEYESMDRVISWSEISGAPTSTPAQIDAAVAASHTHANMAVLDKLSEQDGNLVYNGAPLVTSWTTTNW